MQQFPFEFNRLLFPTLVFRRKPEVPDLLSLEFEVKIRIVDDRLPEELQIDLLFTTREDQPLFINVQVIGLFHNQGGSKEVNESDIHEFVNARALPILWTAMSQTVYNITNRMGMNGVIIKIPVNLQINFQEPTP